MKVKTIKQEVIVPATPVEVYEAFMDAKKHSAFTGSRATCDPRVGGEFTAWDGYISGKNLELEKGKRIVQEWVTTDWPQNYPPSRLELIEVIGLKSLKLLRPPRLAEGDTIGVIAPSYPVLPFQEKYDLGIENLKKFGFKIKEGKTVKLQHMGYMAGTDGQR